MWVALKRTGFGVWSGSKLVGWLNHRGVQSDVPLPLHMHAATFATGLVDDAMRNMVPSVNEPLLQLINAVFRFSVMSGCVETLLRWSGKLCTHLIAKVIRISHAKFHYNRLTTVQNIQKIFKIMRVSFFGTHNMYGQYVLPDYSARIPIKTRGSFIKAIVLGHCFEVFFHHTDSSSHFYIYTTFKT